MKKKPTKAKKTTKSELERPVAYSCNCSCSQCDIGAHERCTSPDCHMPKWNDIKPGNS